MLTIVPAHQAERARPMPADCPSRTRSCDLRSVMLALAVPPAVIDPRHVTENLPEAEVAVWVATFQLNCEQPLGSGNAAVDVRGHRDAMCR